MNYSDLPPNLACKLPRYPVPVALLGRLAVDAAFQGKGLDSILLADACRKVAGASAVLAVAGMIVDAKDETAAAFYRHFGFTALPGRSERLFLPAQVFARWTLLGPPAIRTPSVIPPTRTQYLSYTASRNVTDAGTRVLSDD